LVDSVTSGTKLDFLTKDMSVDFMKRSAQLGHKQAQVQIGNDYVVRDQKQIDETIRWFMIAADSGYAKAYYQLPELNNPASRCWNGSLKPLESILKAFFPIINIQFRLVYLRVLITKSRLSVSKHTDSATRNISS
jgi:hypothetical protein